jgi:RNA polymerase sigma factor (sigma-70 family)
VGVAEEVPYTRTTMVRLAGRWSRRAWRAEIPDEDVAGRLGNDADSSGRIDVAVDVRDALSRLPMAQRAVLVLRYFDDLSEAQTAQVLGCSVGTVKSRASRGLSSLRAMGVLSSSAVSEVPDG